MLFLWVFGPNVEDRLTRMGFLAFYLVGGAVAGGAHALFEANPALGASGAVAAVTGAYIVLFPHTRIKCLLFFIIIGIYQIPAWFFIAFAIAKDLFFAGFGNDNVAYLAHIGGYAFGILVSLVLLWRHVLSREPYDLFTIGRQAYRRRQLREATHRYARTGGPDRRPSSRRNGPGEVPPAAEVPADGPAAHARAAIATLLAQEKHADAAAAYKQLVEEHAATPAVCTLGRRHQLDIANHFFSAGDFEAASYAYQRFLDTYPRDAEAPRVRLILGLINARYLNDPVRARQLLSGLDASLHDATQRELANTLLVELG
jgi:tetratricopeptide (TPR) repeat protein